MRKIVCFFSLKFSILDEQNATKSEEKSTSSNRFDFSLDSTDKTKPSYLLKIKTGEKGLAETATRPAVSLVFQNEKNKSNPHILQTSDKKRTYFRENQTDEFVIPSEFHVEPMKSLTLNVENLTEPWFIENLIVRDIQNGQVCCFFFSIKKMMKTQRFFTIRISFFPFFER